MTFVKSVVCGKTLCHYLNCYNHLKYDMYIIVFNPWVRKLMLNITQLTCGRAGM